MSLPSGFLERVNDDAITVERSVFLNAVDSWAKDWDEVTVIYVEFDDGHAYEIEPADYRSLLNQTQKDKVKNAASSPLP